MKLANRQSEKVIPWRMTPKTYGQYVRWYTAMYLAEELSDEWHDAFDKLKSLPGYPLSRSLEPGEILQPKVVDKIQSVVH